MNDSNIVQNLLESLTKIMRFQHDPENKDLTLSDTIDAMADIARETIRAVRAGAAS
jgi:hypothetical protein